MQFMQKSVLEMYFVPLSHFCSSTKLVFIQETFFFFTFDVVPSYFNCIEFGCNTVYP